MMAIYNLILNYILDIIFIQLKYNNTYRTIITRPEILLGTSYPLVYMIPVKIIWGVFYFYVFNIQENKV